MFRLKKCDASDTSCAHTSEQLSTGCEPGFPTDRGNDSGHFPIQADSGSRVSQRFVGFIFSESNIEVLAQRAQLVISGGCQVLLFVEQPDRVLDGAR